MPGKKRAEKRTSEGSMLSEKPSSGLLELKHSGISEAENVSAKREQELRIPDSYEIINMCKNGIEHIREINERAEKENYSMRERLSLLDITVSENQRMKHELSEKDKTILEFRESISNLSEERAESEVKLLEYKNKISEADRIIKRMRIENIELNSRVKQLETDNSVLGKTITKKEGAESIYSLKKIISEREDEINELKRRILKEREEKENSIMRAKEIEQKLIYSDNVIKEFEKGAGLKIFAEDNLKKDISELKKSISEKDKEIAELRFYISHKNKTDEQLNSDLISARESLKEKEKLLLEMLSNNRSIVELAKASDLISRENSQKLSSARKENEMLSSEAERLRKLVFAQQDEGKRIIDELKMRFEAQKEIISRKATEQEVFLRTRIGELEEGLKTAQNAIYERDEKIKKLIKSMNEKSAELLSSMEESSKVPINILKKAKFSGQIEAGAPKISAIEEKSYASRMSKPSERSYEGTEPAEMKNPEEPMRANYIDKYPEKQQIPQRASKAPLSAAKVKEIASIIDIAMQKDSPEKIKNSLYKSGYSEEEISAAFSEWEKSNK
ncbi:MAG: hypothetical protein NTV63_04245 [Candidatus Woesearchaeota archaeon]|nr:hypothetical protein [Candidatus Woesearchaeota archaeon]